MPNWADILKEIETERTDASARARHSFDRVRRKYLLKLHKHTGRHVIAYYSGFLAKPGISGAEITDDDKNGFMMAVHNLPDRGQKGLDLILHTPGGGIAATESLVDYLHKMFEGNIRAIVPQIAMSAGTMIACWCKSIVMGKHSNLGPIDPQVMGVPAFMVKREFERAYEEIVADSNKAAVWAPILAKYNPTFLDQCELAIKWSDDFVRYGLTNCMFEGDADAAKKAKRIADELGDAEENRTHNRHLHSQFCEAIGLKIESLEADQQLQDLVLTVHHCFMHTLSNTDALKIIENHLGRAVVRKISVPGAAIHQI